MPSRIRIPSQYYSNLFVRYVPIAPEGFASDYEARVASQAREAEAALKAAQAPMARRHGSSKSRFRVSHLLDSGPRWDTRLEVSVSVDPMVWRRKKRCEVDAAERAAKAERQEQFTVESRGAWEPAARAENTAKSGGYGERSRLQLLFM